MEQVYPERSAPELTTVERRRWVFRHPAMIRVTHWLNAIILAGLLMSGLQIFNAHPALYWGKVSTFERPLVSMQATEDDPPQGVTTILGHRFNSTGVLGLSTSAAGEASERAFPDWITLPADQDLATGRRWHWIFAWLLVINGALYLAYGIASGQFWHRLIPGRDQMRDIGGAVREHVTFRFAEGDEAKRYNVIQKLTYLVVVAILLPVQVLAGLTMSPGVNSFAPFLLDLFGGRQSARTVHFVVANLLVLFVIVHVFEVIVSGLWNNMRAMTTGWFVIERRRRPSRHAGSKESAKR